MKYSLTTDINRSLTMRIDGTTIERTIPTQSYLHDDSTNVYTTVDTLVELFTGVDLTQELSEICQLTDDDHECENSCSVEVPKVLFNHCVSLADQLEAMMFEIRPKVQEDADDWKIEPTNNFVYQWLDGNKVMCYATQDEHRGFNYEQEMEFWKGWHHRQTTKDWLRDGLALFMTWTAAGRPGEVRDV